MSTDYTRLITSEHSDKPNFNAVVALTANGIADVTALIQSLTALFDLDTAVGVQLDVVGQWVGVSRNVAGVLLVAFFGFADDASALTFGELSNPVVGGRFLELGDNSTSSAVLQDPEYRLVIRAKIIRNQYDGSIGQLEAAVTDLITIPCRFFDPSTRVVLIRPSAQIDPVITALLTGYDILPRPGGTRYQYVFPISTPYPWITVGTATASGTTVSKPTGANAWDSSAYLALPSTHIYVEWTIPDTTHFLMGGLASNPSGSPNFPTLNYGILTGSAISIYESGVNTLPAGYGNVSPGDKLAVYFDGKEAVYLHNDVIIRVIAGSPGSLSPMFALNVVGSQAQNILIATG